MLGEHAADGETPRDAVIRGIEEELGFAAQFDDGELDADRMTGGPPGSFVVHFRVRDEMHDGSGGATTAGSTGARPLPVSLRNATALPLYYIRHYGPRNDDRVDSQLTYLWYAIFPENHDEIAWHLDDEVADHRWVSMEDAWTWLSNDATGDAEGAQQQRDVGGEATRAVDGDDGGGGDGGAEEEEEDDGPDTGDFCHGTIRSLYQAGLANILQQGRILT